MWVVLSAGERQALEFMEKVKQWVQAFDLAQRVELLIERESPEAVMKSAEVKLPNGSRIIALPANPATARGYSANLILDEFAFHNDSVGIWRAIYPSISNPLKGELKMRVMSTPNGQANKFYGIWTDDGGQWSKHRTTILDAKAAGLGVNIDELRKAAGDEDTWRQEYLCEFIDSARTAFTYEMLAACEDSGASMTWPDGYTASGPVYVGIDVGTIHDPTICVSFERTGGRMVLRECIIAQGMALSDQDAFIDARIARAAAAGIDASGIGLDLAQRLVKRHGGKVTAQPTTATWKRQAFAKLQHAFMDKMIALPASRELREDFHSYQVIGAGETASYRAPRTDDGHGDIASATAHAFSVADKPGGAWDEKAIAGVQLGGVGGYPKFMPRRL